MSTPPNSLSAVIARGAMRLSKARIAIGHSEDNVLDEARSLALHALHLPPEAPAIFAQARLMDEEVVAVEQLFERRISERVPAAYLIGSAPFAGLRLRTDARALVPRSPIAELIEKRFAPWLARRTVTRVLDLCTGGGSLAVAMAVYHPDWQIDAVDLSPEALSLAAENRDLLQVGARLRLIHSDLFAALDEQRYDLIVSNPPYVTAAEYRAMPREYAHEPVLGLVSGEDGLDLTLRMLRDAPAHLTQNALMIVEVGEADRALRRLLPQIPFEWIEFCVGQMGVFALEASALRAGHAQVVDLCAARSL